jgi:hypothetical protein
MIYLPFFKKVGPYSRKLFIRKINLFLPIGFGLLVLLFLLSGCISKRSVALPPSTPEKVRPPSREQRLVRLGYTIQVGSFTQVENARRLANALKQKGIEAYFFVSTPGIYKVRFGDFPTEKLARERAGLLQSQGSIADFYIIRPDDFAASKIEHYGTSYLREELIKTAEKFIGVPYLWGGTSREEGFDCSGLTMVTYQLNGLNLPRTSQAQYETGLPVERKHLDKGDLVFFSTKDPDKISHVGIYIGKGKFIHSPRWGKKIRIDSLSSPFFQKRFAGARTYLEG